MDTSGIGPKIVKQTSHHISQKDSAVKFKKQFSRISTGATMSSNSHHLQETQMKNNSSLYANKKQLSMDKPAFDRLKSIEKINQERVNLIGLKSQSTSKKN